MCDCSASPRYPFILWLTTLSAAHLLCSCQGLAGTILWSCHSKAHAIPALPLSVLFGLSFYAATALSILPHVEQCAIYGWQS